MNRSRPHEGFSLAYTDTHPDGGHADAAVLLLHGWPGDSTDYRHVLPLLDPSWRVIVPDLRGFGGSDRHLLDPDLYYSAPAHAEALLALLDELGIEDLVVGGYDIGSRIAQELARSHPERVAALALAPPLPGGGRRILAPEIVAETWYLQLHRSPLAVPLIDGDADAVGAYLRYFWERWSGPAFPTDTPEMGVLLARYARPGAFAAAVS